MHFDPGVGDNMCGLTGQKETETKHLLGGHPVTPPTPSHLTGLPIVTAMAPHFVPPQGLGVVASMSSFP